MPTYEVWDHAAGRPGRRVATHAVAARREVRPLAKAYAAAAYPGCTSAWDNDCALVVRRDGQYAGTVCIEPVRKETT